MIRWSRLLLIGGVFLYVLAHHYAYVTSISPMMAYMGYVYFQPPLLPLCLSVLIAALPALWMPITVRRPSQVAHWALYTLIAIPVSTVPFYTLDLLNTTPYALVLFTAGVTAAVAALHLFYRLPLLDFRSFRPSVSSASIWMVALVLSVGTYALLFWAFGWTLKFVGLDEVYDIRSSYKLTAAGFLGRVLGYAVGMQGFAINPLLIVFGLVRRQPIPLVFGLLGQVILYSTTAHKSIILTPLMIVAVLATLRWRGRHFGLLWLVGLIGMIVVCLVLDAVLRLGALFTVVITARIISTPGMLSGFYYDFFSHNPQIHLSDATFFSSFIDYPYAMPPPNLIGYTYFGQAGMNANVNVWADGYMNFGFLGMIGVSVFLGALFWVLDSLAVNRDARIVCCLFGIEGFVMSNAGALTSLLSHGIAAVAVIILLLPPIESSAPQARRTRGGRASPAPRGGPVPALRRQPPPPA